jgi:type IV pilus assembly protein PilA
LLWLALVLVAKRSEQGFTLVELMITVVIVGIMATLATFGVMRYLRMAKTGEPVQMIGSIKSSQEAYRAEMLSYLDVSGAKDISASSFYPGATPGTKVFAWGDKSTAVGANFALLGVTSDAPVRFVYACAAGGPSDKPSVANLGATSVTNWPTAATGQQWYVVNAKGDLNGDGTKSSYASASFTGQIFMDQEGE